MANKNCPADLEKVNPWKRYLRWLLRLIILVSALQQLFFGERFFAVLALLALAILIAPRLFTRNRICVIPVEIEILFLIVVFLELIIADANSFYTRVPYYDKFMHLLVSGIIGIVGMMLIYTAHALGKLKASMAVMFAIIVLITIGMGAILEMGEFFYDHILYPVTGHLLTTGLTQGAPLTPALEDTMYDLYFDTLGGVLGAALGVFFIRRAEKNGGELEVIEEIEALVGEEKEER
jgi:hypothetical protein